MKILDILKIERFRAGPVSNRLRGSMQQQQNNNVSPYFISKSLDFRWIWANFDQNRSKNVLGGKKRKYPKNRR